MNRLTPLVLLLVAASISLQCRSRTDDSSQRTTHLAVPVLGTVSDFKLTTQSGSPFGSEQLRGKVWIATVLMTGSPEEFPRQTAMMAELQNQVLRSAVSPSIHLVSLTVEPEKDSPAVLQGNARLAGAHSEHWTYATGSRNTLLEVVDELGVPVNDNARSSGEPITETPLVVLVDREHQVRGRYEGFTAENLAALLHDISLVLMEAPDLDDGSGRTHLAVPPENLDLAWVDVRRDAQLSAARTYEVFHDFTFTDERKESGITFRNKIVDNAGKHSIPNHYDHGNGVAIADVDGDGLLDLYFTSQVGSNELWRNLGRGRFEDATPRAGVALEDRISVSASFADIDNDGDPDLFVTSVRGGNTLFENDGAGIFTDVTSRAGVGYAGHSSAAVFFDYDRDGMLDLFVLNVGIYTKDRLVPVTNGTSPEQSEGRFNYYEGFEDAFEAHLQPDRAEPSVLYRNLGQGRFADVTEEVGLRDVSWSGDATPIDANLDGWPDLYVLNMQGHDEYYENVDGERFVRKSRELFPKSPWGSMGVKVFDYDNDGNMDIYVTDMHSDMSEGVDPAHEKHKSRMQWPDSILATGGESIFGNALFQREESSYREVSDVIGAENYWPWGLSVGDLNADGYDDAFIASSMNYPFRYGVNSVLLNDGGRGFLESEYVVGVEPRRDGRIVTPWYTLACDDADRGHQYCDGRIGDVVVWAALGSRSSAIFDLDDDGDLDVVTNDFNSEPLVLVSNLAETKDDLNYLKVKPVGTASNRDGLGSTVTVSARGRRYVKVLDGATGYLSHGVYPLYFGLGDVAEVDEVRIQWPSGRSQVVTGPIEANRMLIVTEE